MTRQLPSKPSIEQLRKQAKDIHKAYNHGDPSCYAVLRHLHQVKGKSDADILQAQVSLRDVQFALSVEYGFESWAAMKESVRLTEKGGMKLLQQSDSEIAAQTQPLIEGMHAGIDCDDYEKVTSFFSEEMRADFTTEMYQKQRGYCYALMGNCTKVSLCELHRGRDCVDVLWYIECEKQGRPLVLSTKFIEEGGRVVIGWAHLLSALE